MTQSTGHRAIFAIISKRVPAFFAIAPRVPTRFLPTTIALRARTAGAGLALAVLPNVAATIEFETGIKHRSLVELVPPIAD